MFLFYRIYDIGALFGVWMPDRFVFEMVVSFVGDDSSVVKLDVDVMGVFVSDDGHLVSFDIAGGFTGAILFLHDGLLFYFIFF